MNRTAFADPNQSATCSAMGKPITHAAASVRRYGGAIEDYLPIHDFMDDSKGAVSDLRHRYLTHNSWFVRNVIERVFGHELTNSDGRNVSTRQIAEDHVEEDFGTFIPTAQDWAMAMRMEYWMRPGAGGYPPSVAEVVAEARGSRRETSGRGD